MTSMKSEAARKWGLRLHVLWYVVANLAQIVVWWTVTPDHFFWPVWSIVGWGVGLAFHVRALTR
jgi:hypothetical protein